MVTTAEQKQSISGVRTYLPIEDYGIIGDLHTVALVGKNGSIDWYCVPAFDAPSVFGALLDAEKGGYFQIEPQDTSGESRKQLYLPDTNILVTRFLTETGVGEVTDFMPIQQATSPTDRHGIVRAVHVVTGSLSFEMTCRPAFNYARDSHTVEPVEHGVVFRSPNLMLGLFSTVPLQADGQGGARASFTLGEDEWAYFSLRSAEAPAVTTPEQAAAIFATAEVSRDGIYTYTAVNLKKLKLPRGTFRQSEYRFLQSADDTCTGKIIHALSGRCVRTRTSLRNWGLLSEEQNLPGTCGRHCNLPGGL